MPNFVTSSSPSFSAFGQSTNQSDAEHSKYWGWADDAFSGGGLTYQRNLNLLNLENAFNAQEAQKQRDFEQALSDTAISRGVADAKNAGLNPYAVLSNALQASTPSGASASSASSHTSPNTSVMQGLSSAFSTIVGGLVKANTNLADNNTALAVAKLYSSRPRSVNYIDRSNYRFNV